MKRQPPIRCDACQSDQIEYKADNTHKRSWPFIWSCRSCKATVGCHPNTNQPLGYMAGSFTRKLRAYLHSLIDPLWKSGLAKRSEIYSWIARELGIDKDFSHIAELTHAQLQQAITIVSKYAALNDKEIKRLYDKRSRKGRRT